MANETAERLVFQSFADIEIKPRPERPPVDPAWLDGMEDAVEALACSYCPEKAESVHVLPGLFTTPTAVRFACPDHDPGGEWLNAWDWIDGPPDLRNRSRPYTRRDHWLDTKTHGATAVAIVDAAILAGEDAGEWDGPANVGSNVAALLDALPPIGCQVCGELGTRELPGDVLLCDDCKPPCAWCGKPAEFHRREADEPESAAKWVCAECQRRIDATPATPKLRVLNTYTLVTTEPPPLDWVADGIFTRGFLSMPGGREKVGKSMLAKAVGVCMASGGGDVAGIPVKAGLVIDVDAENGERETHRRLRAMGLAPDHASNYVAVEARGFDLRTDLGHLTALVDTYRPALLLLDSFRSLWGGDERDEGQVAGALDPLRGLAHDRDIAIGLVHHARKGGDEYRGSTAIGAAVEWVVMLSREREDKDRTRRRLSNPMARFAPEREDRWLSIRSEGDDGPVTLAEVEAFVPERHPVRDAVADDVADALDPAAPMTVAAVAKAVGRDPKARVVRDALKELAERGLAVRTDVGWVSGVLSLKGADTRTPPFQSQNGHHDNGDGGGEA